MRLCRYNFTVLLTAGCTVGVLVALYILFRFVKFSSSELLLTVSLCGHRAYRLLFITYCVSLSRQTDEAVRVSGDRGVLRLPGRLRSSHQAKTDSPPPPYDSPPPYHVAVVMRTEEADPPPPPDIEMTSSVYI